MTDLGRWFYCKYCYRNTRPIIGADGSLVVCSRCNAGLAPLDQVMKFGSLAAWYADLCRRFALTQKETA